MCGKIGKYVEKKEGKEDENGEGEKDSIKKSNKMQRLLAVKERDGKEIEDIMIKRKKWQRL